MVQNIRFQFQDSYKIGDLLRIMEILRSEDGCPWDREQDHQSIRLNLLEEAYETADAIDRSDSAAMCEELGDVLLQVVFHARLGEEEGAFDFDAVCDGICKKLILRHPHVFGDAVVTDADAVLDRWEQIKHQEKHQNTVTETLESVPAAFPALMRAAKVQKRAAKAGFDWTDAQGPMDKISEEKQELQAAMDAGDAAAMEEELGDLLFSVVNLSRFLKLDAEDTLQRATSKFIRRFSKVESLALEQGLDLHSAGLDALDKLWEQVKSS